ncbi:MAG: hypothetical protein U0869_26285 [Chloroflexota bacterium]
MREFHHGKRLGRLAVAVLMLGAALGAPGPAAAAAPTGLGSIPDCPSAGPGPRVGLPAIAVLDRLDRDGVVTATDVRLRGGPPIHLGAGGFADGPFGGLAVVGERDGVLSRLVVVELRRRCALRRAGVPGLVFGSHVDPVSGSLHLSLVEAGSRRELGIWALDPERIGRPRMVVPPPLGALATAVPRTGELRWDGGPVGRWCAAGWCQERHADGGLRIMAADDGVDPDLGGGSDPTLAVVSPRPVPEEAVARWTRGTPLTYRWNTAEPPPSWMRPAINAAADDFNATRRSRTPTFSFDSGATDTIRYTPTMTATSCATSIACASYAVPDSWTVRIRPQGYDFRWGTLRWCQATDVDGCFDIERVLLHELGHVVGITHPENGGFQLSPGDSVMPALAPSKPHLGWAIHSLRPCDVATLQERYDTPAATTPISACNSVDTALSLAVTSGSVSSGMLVTLTATLRIVDKAAYGAIGGNKLSERVVQLRRRPLGSTGAWTTYTMRAGTDPGTYVLGFNPSASYELQAVYLAPSTEGLNDSASGIVSVRVTDGCTSTCIASGDPMS